MILLDTNVLSNVMQRAPAPAVISWLNQQPATSVWTTAISVFEVEYGLQRLPEGKRRDSLETAFRALISEDLNGRVLAFDVEAAVAAGALSAALESKGRRVDVRDVQIAGIARARKAIVASRNVKHFEHACEVVNPWDADGASA